MKFKLLLMLILFVSFNSFSEEKNAYMTGNKLKELLDSEDVASNRMVNGYVAAIADTLSSNGKDNINGFRACLPYAPLSQLTAIVNKYLNEHPENLHYSANGLVAVSLSKAFPCK